MRRLVILRPEPGASATESKASALGLEPVSIPLFEILPAAWSAPDPSDFDGLVVTSANAFRHGGSELQKLRSLPVYAVGESTAEEGRKAGFSIAIVGRGGAHELAAAVPPGRHLHLAGADHVPIEGIASIACYRSMPIDPPPPLGDLADSVVLVHSARAGQRLAELVTERVGIAIAAISDRAAQACGDGWQSVTVAEAKRDDALLALAARLCHDEIE